jgi:hypothetical protein
VEAHFIGPAVQEWVPKLAAACAVDGFEIYGDPGPKVAEMAGGFGAVVFQYWLGINREGSVISSQFAVLSPYFEALT